MAYFLVDTVGGGTFLNPYRSREGNGGIKFRRDGQHNADAKWIVSLPSDFSHPNATIIGHDKAENPTKGTKTKLENDLGFSKDELTDTRVDDLILRMLSDPPRNGWNPLKSSLVNGIESKPGPRAFDVYVGNELLIRVPEITGGASASDDFNRSNRDLNGDAGWASGEGEYLDCRIVSNEVVHQVGHDYNCNGRMTTPVFGDDQECQVTGTWTAGGLRYAGASVRRASANESGYHGYAIAGTGSELFEVTSSEYEYNSLATSGPAPSSGDVVRITATGSTLKLYVGGPERISLTNTEHTSGYPGLDLVDVDGGTLQLDDWSATDGAIEVGLVGGRLTRSILHGTLVGR
jgi:hypothetical protein